MHGTTIDNAQRIERTCMQTICGMTDYLRASPKGSGRVSLLSGKVMQTVGVAGIISSVIGVPLQKAVENGTDRRHEPLQIFGS
jgi:hypothetical protein